MQHGGACCGNRMKDICEAYSPLLTITPSSFGFLLTAVPHFETNGRTSASLSVSISYWVNDENCQGGKKPRQIDSAVAEAVQVRRGWCCRGDAQRDGNRCYAGGKAIGG